MKFSKFFFIVSVFILSFVTFANAQDKLMILCGVTMKPAIEEIASEFKKSNPVEFQISYSGSGDLQKMIQANKIGDIFFPGTDTFIVNLEKSGEVIERKYAGENKAVLVVAKGNPKKISNLKDLTNNKFKVVLAKASSGSIGKEAEKLLVSAGLLESVTNNVLLYTSDSKDLATAIISGDADVTINWKAAASLPSNKSYMDTIDIKEAVSEKLVFGLLKYTKNKSLAKKFIDFATSKNGRDIFIKYGF